VTHVLMPSPANLFLRRLLSVSTKFASTSPVSIVGDMRDIEWRSFKEGAVQSSYGQLECTEFCVEENEIEVDVTDSPY
jgi:hypothetical protein